MTSTIGGARRVRGREGERSAGGDGGKWCQVPLAGWGLSATGGRGGRCKGCEVAKGIPGCVVTRMQTTQHTPGLPLVHSI